MITNAIGVSFNILALILCTVSASPDTQTLVTRPLSGLRCNAGIGFGSDEVTVASTRPPLPSLSTLHSLLSCSTLLACIGSWCVGASSSVPSGKVHLRAASGLAWRISSTSGPIRFEANGTLKDRLTMVSAGVSGDIGDEATGRLMACGIDRSMFGLDIRPAGVIFSKPCRACPAKLPNLCIFNSYQNPSTKPTEE